MKKYFPILYILLSTIIVFLVIKSFSSINIEYSTKNPITRKTGGRQNFREGFDCSLLPVGATSTAANVIRQVIGVCDGFSGMQTIEPLTTNFGFDRPSGNAGSDGITPISIKKVNDNTTVEWDDSLCDVYPNASACGDVNGCMDNTAYNYDPYANIDSGCVYGVWSTEAVLSVHGEGWTKCVPDCTTATQVTGGDWSATCNNPDSVCEDGAGTLLPSAAWPEPYDCKDGPAGNAPNNGIETTICVPGCMNNTAYNFDGNATVDDGSCMYGVWSTEAVAGGVGGWTACDPDCTTATQAYGGDWSATCTNPDSVCEDAVGTPLSNSYDCAAGPAGNAPDNGTETKICALGCIDNTATNYDEGANTPDPNNPCIFDTGNIVILGPDNNQEYDIIYTSTVEIHAITIVLAPTGEDWDDAYSTWGSVENPIEFPPLPPSPPPRGHA